eukprot:scaffold24794_cov30-Phaeocystis_antarctica.AAC.1
MTVRASVATSVASTVSNYFMQAITAAATDVAAVIVTSVAAAVDAASVATAVVAPAAASISTTVIDHAAASDEASAAIQIDLQHDSIRRDYSSSRTTRRSPLAQQSPTANATAAHPPAYHRASMNGVSSASYSVPNIGPKASEALRVTLAMKARRVGQLSAKGTSTQDSARPTSAPPVKGRTDHNTVVDPTSYSKDVGKTKLCNNWEKGMCRYTNYCRFAQGSHAAIAAQPLERASTT